ncbi:hypothetical protein [Pleomorphovibrio marinus]|uniref:hypothetical protein n=1 Tax=Pleomorphovibrio marinus TaxID=2164132 RepID=UPI000E09F22A|nr:hypothetical protein [Pleomorphovibrio marinus]
MFRKALYGLLFFPLLLACSIEEEPLPTGTQLMLNPNLSQYSDSVSPWTSSQSGSAQIGTSREDFLTGNRSLFIENQDPINIHNASWVQTYTGQMPAPGSQLELTVFLKGENLRIEEGSTASISIYFTVSLPSNEGGSTQNRTVGSDIASSLEGSFDWTPIRITMDSFPPEATSIRVHLGMFGLTTGKIYFDEITLTVL